MKFHKILNIGGMASMQGRVNAIVIVDGPEAFATIAGKPLLAYWMDRLAEAEVHEVRVVARTLTDSLHDFVAAWSHNSRPRLVTARTPSAPGEAAAIAANVDLADQADEVLLIHAGNFSDVNLARMLAFHSDHDQHLTAALFHASEDQAASFVTLDKRKKIVSMTGDRGRSDLAFADVMALSVPLYREIARAGEAKPELDILWVYRDRTWGWPWVWYHRNVADPETLEQVRHEAPAILGDLQRRGRPAVFLDRDGTLIQEVNYLSDPDQVRILPGVAEALRRLRAGGYARVVVTNQSAVGRGMITRERLHEIHESMYRILDEQNAAVDAVYFCPDAPDPDGQPVADDAHRKPGAGMLRAAAADLGLDLEASWMVGDQIGDLIAGDRAGCRGAILVQTGQGLKGNDEPDVPYMVASDLLAASDIILSGEEPQPVRKKSPIFA